jgi:predicted nucleic acid-binding protein
LIEDRPVHSAKPIPFFSAAERGEFQIVTSMVTLIEVLVHPIRSGRADLARQYRDILLHSTGLTTFPIREDIAEEAARLRGSHGLGTPDAIQLATAIRNGATSFLTNDLNLPIMPGLSTLTLDTL